MLKRLLIDNLAVFDHAELPFAPGLTAITGETGAGKTVLTHAVGLISGANADSAIIGPHRAEGYVEAEFDGCAPEALADIVAAEEDSFVLARRLRPDSSRALVDGRAAAARLLREAGQQLLSLTGQHAARQLIDETHQRELLDRFGQHGSLREQVADAFRRRRELREQLAELREQLATARRQEEMLRHEVQLVRELAPQPGEQQELEQERDRLRHAEELRESVLGAAAALNGEGGSPAAADLIATAAGGVLSASAHDANLQQLASELQLLAEQAAEAARALRGLEEAYEADPGRLMEIEQRLASLADLRRRYGGQEIADILQRIETDARELELLEDSDARLQELESQLQQADEQYATRAAELTACREQAAQRLIASAEEHLHELGLAQARLEITIQQSADALHGRDKVTFLLAANPGLPATPLDRGASGGEISRVNLALLLAARSDVGCLIFDEVDAGIGGEVAHALGHKLQELSRSTQVIVITHLAQIAVHADQHLKVQKDQADDQLTRTTVCSLTSRELRDAELARLMGASGEQAEQAAALVRQAAGLTD